MAEPTSTSGMSLTVLAIAVLGPMLGPYAVIIFAALAGAMWPLYAAETTSRKAGAWLLIRVTTTAVVLTAFLATAIERRYGVSAVESLGPVALLIGALGNGWQRIWEAAGGVLRALLEQLASRGRQ